MRMTSFEEGRDNFFCLTCLLFNIGNSTLRSYFKNTWPKVNGTGVAWCDKPEDGARFLALVTGLKLASHEKAAVQNGNTNEWDLTLLVKLLMHSKFAPPSPGFVLPYSQEYDWLDDIREIRNTLIGHAKETILSQAEFSAAWQEASDILEKFGATKEEIAAVQNDIERTRKDAQEYRQRLLEAEEREKKVVEHLKTVDERLVNIEKNQNEIYDGILQKRQEGKSVNEEVQGMAAAPRIVHWNINVKAEAGAKVVISDIENTLAQKKKEIIAGVLDEDGYSEVTESADDEKKQPSEVDEYEMYEDLGEVYDSPKAPSQTDVTAKVKPQNSDGDDSDSSDDEYEGGAEYRPITQLNHETYCATKSARAKKKDLAYDELLPSYKKTYLSGEWKAEPLSEVVTSKVEGINQEEWSAEKLFTDPDDYLKRMAASGGNTKAKVEQKFLQEILPSLEGECKKSDHHSDEIYQILAKLSCCEHSQSTVKHSLYLLRHLLTKDKLELSNARTIWKLEKILRGSFAGKEGLFNLESSAAQRLRLTVYSKVLCLLAICRSKGFLTFRSTDLEECEDAKVLLQNLKKCFCDKSYKKKDRLQLVAELTLTCLKWIFTDKKPIAQLREALECFKKHLLEFDSSSEKLSSLAKKLHGCGWFCLQVVLCCIEHEMRSDPNALELLLKVVDWVTSKKTPDWKFFTAVSGVLTNAAMTNRNKDIRIKAGWKLVEYYCRAKKIKKTPEVAEAIEKKMSRVLFSPDPPVRTALAREFFADSREDISVDQIMNYFCWFYKNQALERKKIIRETKSKVVYLGSFQGEKVAIKAIRPSMQYLGNSASEEMQKVMSALITEAYFLRRLNEATRHPHIIHLLCCNTVRIPYHFITEYLMRGNLLKYLRQDCRSESPLRELGQLSQWCIEILDALVFLSKYKIVHGRIMAKSVFVGEDEVCKLSGFSAAEQECDVYTYWSREAQLDSPGIVRWLAPEVLQEGHYSKASDAWAFGVLMYEVFSLGCDPFRPGHDGRPLDDDCKVVDLVILGNHLPRLSCFDSRLYELMTTCWKMKPSARNRVEQLRGDLFKLQLEFMKIDAPFPGRPPPVFPEVQPSNQEEALRKNKELKDYINSKRKKKPSVTGSSDYHQIANKIPRRVGHGSHSSVCPPPLPKHASKQNKPVRKILFHPPSPPCLRLWRMEQFLRAHHPSKSHIKRIKKGSLSFRNSNSKGDNVKMNQGTQQMYFAKYVFGSYWNKDSERPTFMFPKGCELAVYREADTDWWEGQCLKTGAFGFINKGHVTIHEEKVTVMEEIIRMADCNHLKNLKNLLDGKENFVRIILIESFGADRTRMVSQLGISGNLKNLAVPEKCLTYLCQVAAALEFLHYNHIIHCDIQAANVFFVSNDVVQLGQLGRSRQLTVPSDETSSATCTINQEMPEELLQWSPPEVIKSGSYSHASDVWSFGIFGWEICTFFVPVGEYAVPDTPFSFIFKNDLAKERRSALLTHLKRGKRLSQPCGCPDWLFLVLAVCWRYFARDRPSMGTIHEHLTNRKPIIPVSEGKDHTALLTEVWDDIDTPFTRPRCSNLVNAKDRPTRKPYKAPDIQRTSRGKAASAETLYESFPTRSAVNLQLPPPPPLSSGGEEIYIDSNSTDVSAAKKDFNSTKPSHGNGGDDRDISGFRDLPSSESLYSAAPSDPTGGNDEVIYADSDCRNLSSNIDLKCHPSEADDEEIHEEPGDSTLLSNRQCNEENSYAPLETSEASGYMHLCKETILPSKFSETVKEMKVSASPSAECLNCHEDGVTETAGSNDAKGAFSDATEVSSVATGLSSGASSDAIGVSSGSSSDATGVTSDSAGVSSGASPDASGVSSGASCNASGVSSGASSDASGVSSGASSDATGVTSDSAGVSSGASPDASGVSSGASSDAIGVSSDATGLSSEVSSDSAGACSDGTGVSDAIQCEMIDYNSSLPNRESSAVNTTHL